MPLLLIRNDRPSPFDGVSRGDKAYHTVADPFSDRENQAIHIHRAPLANIRHRRAKHQSVDALSSMYVYVIAVANTLWGTTPRQKDAATIFLGKAFSCPSVCLAPAFSNIIRSKCSRNDSSRSLLVTIHSSRFVDAQYRFLWRRRCLRSCYGVAEISFPVDFHEQVPFGCPPHPLSASPVL